jgi:hypothetical protein
MPHRVSIIHARRNATPKQLTLSNVRAKKKKSCLHISWGCTISYFCTRVFQAEYKPGHSGQSLFRSAHPSSAWLNSLEAGAILSWGAVFSVDVLLLSAESSDFGEACIL